MKKLLIIYPIFFLIKALQFFLKGVLVLSDYAEKFFKNRLKNPTKAEGVELKYEKI